ncbi:unnamed protein product [Discosporangium mesarthrocarpum]
MPRHLPVFSFDGAAHRPATLSKPRPPQVHVSDEFSSCTAPVSPVVSEDDLVSFYLFRHGETNFNAVGRIQGTLDSSRLTEQGVSQALEAGKALASFPGLDLGSTVVVSPMRRAQQTLDCVREEMKRVGKDFSTVEVVTDIREIELFEWQGKLKDDLKNEMPEDYAMWKADPTNFNLGGRYPARDLWVRARSSWEEIWSLESIKNQRKTLVVAHNAINQALLWTALGADVSLFRKLSWPNCAVLELQWRRGKEIAERYRWLLPEESSFVEAADAEVLLRDAQSDTVFTL